MDSPRLFEVAEPTHVEEDQHDLMDFQSLAGAEGAEFKLQALGYIINAGGSLRSTGGEVEGFPYDFRVTSTLGQDFLVLARGTPDLKKRSGFRRTDTVQKAGFIALQLSRLTDIPILLVTSDLPRKASKAELYLSTLRDDVWDVVAVRHDLRGFQRLHRYMQAPPTRSPLPAPWRGTEWRRHPNPYQLQLQLSVDFGLSSESA